jgi:hypothetical protein
LSSLILEMSIFAAWELIQMLLDVLAQNPKKRPPTVDFEGVAALSALASFTEPILSDGAQVPPTKRAKNNLSDSFVTCSLSLYLRRMYHFKPSCVVMHAGQV